MQDSHSRHPGSNRAAVLIAVFLAGLIIAPEPTLPAQTGKTIRQCQPSYPSRRGYVQVTVAVKDCKKAVRAAIAKWRAEVAALYGPGYAYWWERADKEVCTCKWVMVDHALAHVRGRPCIIRDRLGGIIPPELKITPKEDPLKDYHWGQCN